MESRNRNSTNTGRNRQRVMTIKIKPTSTTATIEHNDSTILTVDSSGNITPSNDLYQKAPAFQARRSSSSQTITANTWTKLRYQTEVFDTHSLYDNATNYRFTPDVAGYYNIVCSARCDGTGKVNMIVSIYKNGVAYSYTNKRDTSDGAEYITNNSIVYLDGVDDYIEGYVHIGNATNASVAPVAQASALSGYLVSV
jgi:hypothetical protein